MTKEEFDELKAAFEALAEHDHQLGAALLMLLTLLVRALPVQAEAQAT